MRLLRRSLSVRLTSHRHRALRAGLAMAVIAGAACVILFQRETSSSEGPGTSDTFVTVRSQEQVPKEESPWGWIRWLMNSKANERSGLTFGVVEIQPRQQNPFHRHANSEELLYVVAGTCEHRTGDRTDVLKPGDLIRIPPGMPHSARTFGEPLRAIVVYNTGQRQFEVVEPKKTE